jgi:hypothetical protein
MTNFAILRRTDLYLGCSGEEEARELEARIRTISWLPLPLLMLFTVAFNVGMGSLTWVVATEASCAYAYETLFLFVIVLVLVRLLWTLWTTYIRTDVVRRFFSNSFLRQFFQIVLYR